MPAVAGYVGICGGTRLLLLPSLAGAFLAPIGVLSSAARFSTSSASSSPFRDRKVGSQAICVSDRTLLTLVVCEIFETEAFFTEYFFVEVIATCVVVCVSVCGRAGCVPCCVLVPDAAGANATN